MADVVAADTTPTAEKQKTPEAAAEQSDTQQQASSDASAPSAPEVTFKVRW